MAGKKRMMEKVEKKAREDADSLRVRGLVAWGECANLG